MWPCYCFFFKKFPSLPKVSGLNINAIKTVLADSLDDVAAAFQRNRDEGIPERGNNRWLSSTVRNAATLQVSRWTFKQRPPGKLFIVVTRQDAPWSIVNDDLEPYALCVSIADRDNAQSRQYA